MPGWVYVISNKSMPGIVKVGYTDRSPESRADELNHTGNPHSYLADYGMLVDNPKSIERRVHKNLRYCREGREWFRCSAEDAIAAIQIVAGSTVIKEIFYRADRDRAYHLRREQELKNERQRKEAEQEATKKRQIVEQKKEFERQLAEINARYNKRISDLTARSSDKWIMIVSIIVIAIIIDNQYPKMGWGFFLILAGFLGLATASCIIGFLEKSQKSSSDYNTKHQALITERDKEIERLRISPEQTPKSVNAGTPTLETENSSETLVSDLHKQFGPHTEFKFGVPFNNKDEKKIIFAFVFILVVLVIVLVALFANNPPYEQHKPVSQYSQSPVNTESQGKPVPRNLFENRVKKSQMNSEEAKIRKEAAERRQTDELAKETAKKEAFERQSEDLVAEGKNSSDKGRYVDAMSKLDRAININDKNYIAYLYRGVTNYRMKKYNDAITDCSKAISLNGEFVDALFYRGLAYQQLKQYKNATIDYNRANLLNPQEINVLRQRGLVYQITGHENWAFADFERACKLGSKLSCDQLKNYVGFTSKSK